jgi:triosephosphate isomerase
LRKPYIAGNWKMNLERRGALELAGALREAFGARTDVDATSELAAWTMVARVVMNLDETVTKG